MKLNEAIAKRILELCDERGITPNKLCTLSGVVQSTVNKILNGKSKNPKLETIRCLCIGANIEIVDFFGPQYFIELDD